jgi:eukaryotic-like serine/threonine-protein kinase
VLAEGAEALGGSAQRTPQPSDVTLETEGRYQLLRELGEGAEGRVFAAWDHHLAREVALKVPHLESALRPLREARLVARLDHPGIATVFEIGRRADGSLYSVQRLVHAEHGPRSLRHAFDQLRTLPERLGLVPRLLQVSQAVGYAHTKGVVHRDLKPENIALGDGGETVVLDWGLALQLDANDPAEARRAVGTRGYMSPEQAAGLPVGAQTDVYSLGVMLRSAAPETAARHCRAGVCRGSRAALPDRRCALV